MGAFIGIAVVGLFALLARKPRASSSPGSSSSASQPTVAGSRASRGTDLGYPPAVSRVLRLIRSGKVPAPSEIEQAARSADRAGFYEAADRLRDYNRPPPSVPKALADLINQSATVGQLEEAADEAEAARFAHQADLLRASAALLRGIEAPAPGTDPAEGENASPGAEEEATEAAGATDAKPAPAPAPPPSRFWQNAPPPGMASWPDGPGSGLSDPGPPASGDDSAQGGDGGDYDSGAGEG